MANEEKVLKLVEADNFNSTCKNCAFFPGGDSSLCFAPWTDFQMEEENINPCYEGVYRYITGTPAAHHQALVEHNVDYLRIREKGAQNGRC